MKTKLLSLFVALLATTALWASNVITYTATEKLPETTDEWVTGLHINAFNVAITSHVFSNGIGTITFAGEVTTIGKQAFCFCSDLTSVTIGNSVTTIGNNAFYWCEGLTSINVDAANTHYCSIDGVLFNYAKDTLIQYPIGNTRTEYMIPNSVTTIGNYAFSSCFGLTSVTIPNSVTTIGNYAFECCYGLTSVTIGNSVTTIGNNAFYGCVNLTSVTIPNSVTSIGNSAFSSCFGLTSVTIPNSVTSIGESAFESCYGLTSINVDAANTHYCSIDGVLFNYAKDMLIQYPAANTRTEYTIPNSVTTIGNRAFRECSNLTSVTIPNSVTTIGELAFFGCTGLTSINVDAANTHYCSIDGVLFNYAKDTLIQYPIGNTRTEYMIPNSVTTIGNYAFAYCYGLTSVTIPNSVTSIGESAFYGCSGLTSVTCYAVTPPKCGYGVFKYISQDANVYVPASALTDYQNAEVWKDMQLYPIAADVTPMDDENPVVTPSDQDVTITWPITDGTDTYTLTITKNGETVCVLTFNANGQLTNIAFAAPGHNGAHQAPAATLTAQGYQFTVTGLTPGTAYNYSVVATDAGGKTVAEHTGNFSTTGGATTNISQTQDTKHQTLKYLRNGQLLINRNGQHYSAVGERIR